MKKETQVQPRGADGAEKVSELFGQRSGNQKPLQAQDGVSVQAEPDTGTGESDGQPGYVTRAEMERIKAEAVAEARRTAQQISDKAASTSQKAYQEAMRTLPALTVTAADWQLDCIGASPVDVTALTLDDLSMSSRQHIVLKATTAGGLTQYRPYMLVGDGTTGRQLILEAEL